MTDIDSTFIVNFSDETGVSSFDFDTLAEAVNLASICGRSGHIREYTVNRFDGSRTDRIVAKF